MATTTSPGSNSPASDPEEQLVDLPGFEKIPPPPADPMDPTHATTSLPPSPPELHPPGWNPADPADAGDASPGSTKPSTSTRASTADWRDFAPLLHTLVALVSVGVRFLRTRRGIALPDTVWLADEGDQAAIGDPLARIAARHSPLSDGDTTDVVDGLVATVATAGYAVKNLELERVYGQPVVDASQPDPGDDAG